MNAKAIFRFMALSLLGLAVAPLVPALLALRGEGSQGGYLIAALTAGFGAAMFLAIEQGLKRRQPVRGGLRELLLALTLFWCALPLVAGIPFLIEEGGLLGAWFEAVSALTTTGAWLSEPDARATDAGMLYRASLQWLGGGVSLATAAAVFVRPEFIGIAPLVPPFARGEGGSYLRAFDHAVRAFMPVYGAITAAAALVLMALGQPPVVALVIAMSSIATGGFIPLPGGIEALPPAAMIVTLSVMVLGALNFVVVATVALGQGGRMRAADDTESRTFLLLIPPVAVLFWLSGGAGDVDRLATDLANTVAVLSTSGTMISPMPSMVPVLVTAAIGGAAVSTAGGIKILRWLITFRRTGEELWKLIHPGAVVGRAPSSNEFGVWIHALAFTILIGALVLTTGFFGYSLEVSAAAAVAVIANAGPLIGVAPELPASWGIFDPTLQFAFGLGMIAGRLELVVLLVAISRRFWQG